MEANSVDVHTVHATPPALMDASALRRPAWFKIGLSLTFGEQSALTPVQYSAEGGFRQLTVPFLNRLYVDLGIVPEPGSRRPTTEKALVMALLKHVFPARSPDGLNEIWERRGKTKDCADNEQPSLLEEMDLADAAEGLLREDDAEDFINHVQSARGNGRSSRSRANAQPPATGIAPVHPPVGAAAAAAVSIHRVPPRQQTVAWARAFIPQRPSCNIEIQVSERRHTWIGTFRDRPAGSRTESRSYGQDTMVTKFQAFIVVLRFLWQCETEAYGTVCPCDLDAALA